MQKSLNLVLMGVIMGSGKSGTFPSTGSVATDGPLTGSPSELL